MLAAVAAAGADAIRFAATYRSPDAQRNLIAACRTARLACVLEISEADAVSSSSADTSWLATTPSDISNGPLLLEFARAHRPILLAIGAASDAEIREALGVIAFGYVQSPASVPHPRGFREAFRSAAGKAALADKVTLLHDRLDLAALAERTRTFELPVGLYDAIGGAAVAAAAVALGARVIVKPADESFAATVAAIRDVEMALHSGPRPQPETRKALVTLAPIAPGEMFTPTNLGLRLAPAKGVSPMALWSYLGKPSARGYQAGEMIDPA